MVQSVFLFASLLIFSRSFTRVPHQRIHASADDQCIAGDKRPAHKFTFEQFVRQAEQTDADIEKISNRPLGKASQNTSIDKSYCRLPVCKQKPTDNFSEQYHENKTA